ncbi:hypothetical protein EW146_g228 [Bondarzewia mesenterica]|uniref:CNH domain-containing protein n=1 Tax=Bondarzewia mesenterica TaxID=1095465 RepID=A0A4S4M7X1_9AGAM|nr:hypothetical protein EW146_g228 [Bondarzewia mesenterica]
MAPFEQPQTIVSGFKERIEALTVQGDRLYVGTATGSLHIYSVHDSSGEPAELIETKKGLTRKAIEQLGYVKDINSLVVLSESQVTLYPLPELSPATPLSKAKAAFSFAVHTSVQHLLPDGKTIKSPDVEFGKTTTVPSVITRLVVGCRRKLVIYSWKDGEAQGVKEAPLPHSARTITFLNNHVMCLAYSPTDYILFSLETMSTTEVTTPPTASLSATNISNMGMGALSGLGGYMTLGLGAKSKPCTVSVGESEVLIAKDNVGIFVGVDGKPSRSAQIDWPSPPEDICQRIDSCSMERILMIEMREAFVKPYIFSIFPAGTVPTSQTNGSSSALPSQPSFHPSPVLQIRSSISLVPAQTLPFPFTSSPPTPSTSHYAMRLLTPSPAAKSPLFLVSTPVDRTTATNEGSSIWQFRMRSWGEQLDELVNAGLYSDAIALLDTIDAAVLPDKEHRISLTRGLNAVAQFKSGKYDEALDAFIDLNVNPAKVVALYPHAVSGRLSVPQERWIPLFGGPDVPKASSEGLPTSEHDDSGGDGETEGNSSDHHSPSRGRLSPVKDAKKPKTPLDAIRPASKDPETASISSARRVRPRDEFSRSVESLLRYLPDRRQKIAGALEAFQITPAQSHQHVGVSEASVAELFEIPSSPMSALTPEQLIRYARIVDTALFKSYLIIRPGLLGPLCRRDNWCEVEEVEEVLAAREKYTELIDLYNGKKMHAKALDLLRNISIKTFKSSRWVFDQDPDIAFEIFTSEEVELPQEQVASFLESINPRYCARYLEFLIDERGEESYKFHDRLAELYLRMTQEAKKKGDDGKAHLNLRKVWLNVVQFVEARKEVYSKFLNFVDTTNHYRIDRLFGLLPPDDLYEAKAILLGRLNRHNHALELYVYRLRDYEKAEEYCKRIYHPGTETGDIFLTLLRIYLRPLVKTTDDLLHPALELISRHSPRLDAEETLQLLPPLVTAQNLRAFLLEALRAPIFDTRAIRDVSKAHNEQVARKLMYLQSNRVKVTDSRICPQCHKRIGHSVIAVHAPGGEVTHYQCREAFSRKLKEMRHS